MTATNATAQRVRLAAVRYELQIPVHQSLTKTSEKAPSFRAGMNRRRV